MCIWGQVSPICHFGFSSTRFVLRSAQDDLFVMNSQDDSKGDRGFPQCIEMNIDLVILTNSGLYVFGVEKLTLLEIIAVNRLVCLFV